MRRREMFRGILRGLLVGAGAIVGLQPITAATTAASDRPKVAYHLDDTDKVSFVLGNIHNHFTGTNGNADIVLVVHGPALSVFRTAGQGAALSERFARLTRAGLTPFACSHTMQGLDISLGDLLPGFAVAENGGVVKLAELQTKGYAYLRP